MQNLKFQVPSSKETSNAKSQMEIALLGFWNLSLLWNLELGAWNFRFEQFCKSMTTPKTASWMMRAIRAAAPGGGTAKAESGKVETKNEDLKL